MVRTRLKSVKSTKKLVFTTVMLVVLIASISLLPTSILARDMTGKGGIGLLQSSNPGMSRLPTLLFRYWGPKLSWEVLLGFDLVRDRSTTAVYLKAAPIDQVFMLDQNVPQDAGAVSSTVDRAVPWFFDTTYIFTGLGVHRIIHSSSNLTVTLGLRATARFSSTESKARSSTSKGTLTSALALLTEIPFQAEVFLSDHSSITASVGLSASISSSFSATDAKDGGLVDLLGTNGANRGGTTLELGGSYSGGVGFTYYF